MGSVVIGWTAMLEQRRHQHPLLQGHARIRKRHANPAFMWKMFKQLNDWKVVVPW
jgi:hypothetical protein